MKNILLSSAALLGLATGALAADLPSRRAPAPVIAAVPVFTWTGFYVGVNAGYGWNTGGDVVDYPFAYTSGDGGFIGGAQAGYSHQIGAFVLGLEGDVQLADLGDRQFYLVDPEVQVKRVPGTDRFLSGSWFGTVRARAGVAFDRALIYATGGFAFADDANGWTVGGGVEYAFTNNLSAKIEGLYVNLDSDDDFADFDGETDFGVIRAGLNFRFGTY
jgi:outer membrane immunogenic protein